MAERRPRLLVVDDNRTNQVVLEALLDTAAFGVSSVSSAEAMLSVLDLPEPVDLLIVDVFMPSMNGIEAIRTVRQREEKRRLARVPAIAVSAARESVVREACLAAGADAFFFRPLRRTTFLETVSHCLMATALRGDTREKDNAYATPGLVSSGSEFCLEYAKAWANDSFAAISFMQTALHAGNAEFFREQIMSLASASSEIRGSNIRAICDLLVKLPDVTLLAEGTTVIESLEFESRRLASILEECAIGSSQSGPAS